MPVIEHYRSEGKLKQIKADRTPEEVFEDVQRIVEELGGAQSTCQCSHACTTCKRDRELLLPFVGLHICLHLQGRSHAAQELAVAFMTNSSNAILPL